MMEKCHGQDFLSKTMLCVQEKALKGFSLLPGLKREVQVFLHRSPLDISYEK